MLYGSILYKVNYAERVREKLQEIAEQVKVGNEVYFDRDIRIQIRYGATPVKLS